MGLQAAHVFSDHKARETARGRPAMIANLIFLFVAALQLTAIWFAWRAISVARTSQGALGWVIFLLAVPWLAVPMFLFFGHHRFRHYVKARRDSEEVMTGVRDYRVRHAPTTPPAFPIRAFEAISDMPVVGGNNMVLLVDGPTTFDAIFATIDAAQDYVLVQFYIVRDDPTGRALLDRLVAAARRGVTVRFVCDPMGSVKLSTQYLDDLRAAGVQVVDPSEMRGPKTRFHLNFRNHRKTVIVDGVVGFTGGLNVGEEYMGRDPAFGHWRDTHIRLQGPMVSQLQLIFAKDWHWATGKALIGELNWEAGRTEADMPALIVATGPGDSMETGALFFFSTIANATKRIWIASPYFVPDRDVLTALKHAALEGLDVRILLPEVVDHRVPWLAAFAFFDEIREACVQVWRYTDGFMHQKAIVVDDAFAALGTTNLDNRSFRLNFEAMAAFFDPRSAAAVEQMLAADFTRASQLDKPLAAQPRMVRFGAPVSRLFAPIL